MPWEGSCRQNPGPRNTNRIGGGDGDVLSGGGTGFENVFAGSASWHYGAIGLVELPKRISLSASVHGRDGYAVPMFIRLDAFAADGILARQDLQIREAAFHRTDDLHLVDLRLGWAPRLGGHVAVDLSLEVFNVLDDDTVLQYRRRHPCRDTDFDSRCNDPPAVTISRRRGRRETWGRRSRSSAAGPSVSARPDLVPVSVGVLGAALGLVRYHLTGTFTIR